MTSSENAASPFTMPIGTVMAYGVDIDNLPDGWFPCNGSDIPEQYGELIGLLQSDKTPDLSGMTVIGTGLFQGKINYNLGDSGGEVQHTLSTDEIPSHSHDISYETDCAGTGCSESDDIFCSNKPVTPTGLSTGSTGGGMAHNNMQPYFVMNYIIYAGIPTN